MRDVSRAAPAATRTRDYERGVSRRFGCSETGIIETQETGNAEDRATTSATPETQIDSTRTTTAAQKDVVSCRHRLILGLGSVKRLVVRVQFYK